MSKQQEYSAWNPGLSANLPRELSSLETIFQTPNVYTRYDEVGANIHIPEAEHEEDFGINFRRITNDILYQHIAPLYASIEADFQSLSAAIKVEVDRLLAEEVMLEPKAAVQGSSYLENVNICWSITK